jgi:phosphatidylglycerophosphate synthase
MNLANLFTFFRIIVVIPIAILISKPTVTNLYVVLMLIALAFLTDGLDGLAARILKQETKYGALLDIIGDRVLETSLWLILAAQGLVPSIIGVIFIVRGTLTDTIRQQAYANSGVTPFAMMSSSLGKLIVSSRASRLLYGVIKIFTFCFAIYVLISRVNQSASYVQLYSVLQFFAWASTIYNIVRALPVFAEAKIIFSRSTSR